MNKIHVPLKQIILSAPVVADFAPWQTVVRKWVQSSGASIHEIGIPLLKKWMQEHPGDTKTAERLAQWEQRFNGREAA